MKIISFVTLIPKAAFVYLGFSKTAEYFVEVNPPHMLSFHYITFIYPLSYNNPKYPKNKYSILLSTA